MIYSVYLHKQYDFIYWTLKLIRNDIIFNNDCKLIIGSDYKQKSKTSH